MEDIDFWLNFGRKLQKLGLEGKNSWALEVEEQVFKVELVTTIVFEHVTQLVETIELDFEFVQVIELVSSKSSQIIPKLVYLSPRTILVMNWSG